MSIIYSIKCLGCGNELIIEKMELDRDNDLKISVNQCVSCVDEAYKKGKDEGQE